MHERERKARGRERLLGEADHHDRVLAAGEEQGRTLELRRDLAHDEDGLVLQLGEVREIERTHETGGVARWSRGRTQVCRRASDASGVSLSVGMTFAGSEGRGGSKAESRPVKSATAPDAALA